MLNTILLLLCLIFGNVHTSYFKQGVKERLARKNQRDSKIDAYELLIHENHMKNKVTTNTSSSANSELTEYPNSKPSSEEVTENASEKPHCEEHKFSGLNYQKDCSASFDGGECTIECNPGYAGTAVVSCTTTGWAPLVEPQCVQLHTEKEINDINQIEDINEIVHAENKSSIPEEKETHDDSEKQIQVIDKTNNVEEHENNETDEKEILIFELEKTKDELKKKENKLKEKENKLKEKENKLKEKENELKEKQRKQIQYVVKIREKNKRLMERQENLNTELRELKRKLEQSNDEMTVSSNQNSALLQELENETAENEELKIQNTQVEGANILLTQNLDKIKQENVNLKGRIKSMTILSKEQCTENLIKHTQVEELSKNLDKRKKEKVYLTKNIKSLELGNEKLLQEKIMVLEAKDELEKEKKQLQDYISELQSKHNEMYTEKSLKIKENEELNEYIRKLNHKKKDIYTQNEILQKEIKEQIDEINLLKPAIKDINTRMNEIKLILENKRKQLGNVSEIVQAYHDNADIEIIRSSKSCENYYDIWKKSMTNWDEAEMIDPKIANKCFQEVFAQTKYNAEKNVKSEVLGLGMKNIEIILLVSCSVLFGLAAGIIVYFIWKNNKQSNKKDEFDHEFKPSPTLSDILKNPDIVHERSYESSSMPLRSNPNLKLDFKSEYTTTTTTYFCANQTFMYQQEKEMQMLSPSHSRPALSLQGIEYKPNTSNTSKFCSTLEPIFENENLEREFSLENEDLEREFSFENEEENQNNKEKSFEKKEIIIYSKENISMDNQLC